MTENLNEVSKKYEIILADPPWRYQDVSCSGACAKHYSTMSVEEIKALPIKDLAAKDSVLFLWATYPMMKEALQVIEAWGFEYKSIAFQWVKRNHGGNGWFFGLGRWTRGNTEPCLIATRGKPTREANDVSQLIISPIHKHSQKPGAQYVLIEKLMGKKTRLELFARNQRKGWDSWGNQLSVTIQEPLEFPEQSVFVVKS